MSDAYEPGSDEEMAAAVLWRAAEELSPEEREEPDVREEIARLPPRPDRLLAIMAEHPEMGRPLHELLDKPSK